MRNLYRGATGYADDVPLDDLRRLHVRTRLDDVIAEHIRARRSVVLTGNPGDGKTHLAAYPGARNRRARRSRGTRCQRRAQ